MDSFEDWATKNISLFQSYRFPLRKLGGSLYDLLVHYDANSPVLIDDKFDLRVSMEKRENINEESFIFISKCVWKGAIYEFPAFFKQNADIKDRFKNFHSQKSVFSEEKGNKSVKKVLSDQLLCCDDEILDLRKYTIKSFDELIQKLKLLTNIKCIDLRNTEFYERSEEICNEFSNVEVINGKFSNNWGEWALLYVSHSKTPENVVRIDLKGMGLKKINAQAFSRFRNLLVLDIRDNQCDLAQIKSAIPSLLSIYTDSVDLNPADFVFFNGVDTSTGDHHNPVPECYWDHMQVIAEECYLFDEISFAIKHSLDPNFCVMPVRSPISDSVFLAIWNTKKVLNGEKITANLFPLIRFINDEEIPPKEPILPMKNLNSKFLSSVPKKRPIKVFIDYPAFIENLHSPHFQIVKEPSEADLLWIVSKQQQHDDYEVLYNRGLLINQIEGEYNITVKDLLFKTCTQYLENVSFLPETYIMSDVYDANRFIKRHKELTENGESNAFIIKCFNQTRASKMVVTTSASEVLKHSSGTYRIAQRYIWNPLNIFGQKFDLRFIVLLKSVKPLELFAYKVFWPRLSPKKWSLDDLDDYERHFTVMNYRAPGKVTSKTWVDFVEQYNIENPNFNWDLMIERIYKSFLDLFLCGAQKMVQSPLTKSIYGIDLMITNDYQPVILECNFQPDCKRACNLCPTFVDDIFEVLFINQPVRNDKVFKIKLE